MPAGGRPTQSCSNTSPLHGANAVSGLPEGDTQQPSSGQTRESSKGSPGKEIERGRNSPGQSRSLPRTRDVWRKSDAGRGPRPPSQNGKPPPRTEKQRTVFKGEVPEDASVAIIGGGLSGLICAQVLSDQGVRSTVFDTGKRGLGGRLATRHISTPGGQSLVFDHAAQYFTVSDPIVQKMVDQWEAEGLVRVWDGSVGNLKRGQFTPLPGEQPKYLGVDGMMGLADRLGEKVRQGLAQTRRPCWVSRMEPSGGKWRLSENGRHEGDFDFVVIAHNGKCANRLLAPAGVPEVAAQMKSLRLSSIWALLAAFDKPLPLPPEIDAAFVQDVPSVSWACNNNRKLKRSGPECWTLFSTAGYGKDNKVPQEAVPAPVAAKVTREMLDGFEDAWGVSRGTFPAPIFTKTQLWGAALPTNTPGVPCIFDPLGRVGICGDWLLGSSMQDAVLSGRAMALQIAEFCQRRGAGTESLASGLTKRLRPVAGHDIGSFPVTEAELLTVT
ncbi:hypothetical protein KFL_001500160 [Klebsormidium nitens]|uniref:Amine oxidase domain-containing protein n=1 Tax=Klebsormidium nitens TaxID=105231 RepID=A0A1Y1I426_KLENI|nr:hypothetical protein KFL_001500160 [Klebsormidium nitens]|eukprot:GAQ83486.1 hypothetical protein KFL_001500160 [Klebsormidium nitens]